MQKEKKNRLLLPEAEGWVVEETNDFFNLFK